MQLLTLLIIVRKDLNALKIINPSLLKIIQCT